MSSWKAKDPGLSATAVVPAYNEEDFIWETLWSLGEQHRLSEVLVVDDASTDKTAAIVKEFIRRRSPHMYPKFKLIQNEVNQGTKSQALNTSLPEVKTDIFICVDADTTLRENSVDKLMHAFSLPWIGAACGNVCSRASHTFWASGRKGEYLVGQTLAKRAQSNMNVVLVASGCFFGIRTELLRAMGGFQERTMAEDMDATWTAVENGWDVAYAHKADCVVNDPLTWKVYRSQVERWYRGYFQCMVVRKGKLFRRPKLGITVYAYAVANTLLTPFALAGGAVFAYNRPEWAAIGIIALMLFNLVFATYPALADGRPLRELLGIPRHVLNMTVVAFVSYALWVRCGWLELVKKESLTTWVKGH